MTMPRQIRSLHSLPDRYMHRFAKLKLHLCRDVADRDNVLQATSEEPSTAGPNWNEDYPEDATAIVIHHTSILRNKRLLLAYQCASAL